MSGSSELNTLNEDQENHASSQKEIIESIKEFPHSRKNDGGSSAGSENIYPQKILSSHINTGLSSQMPATNGKNRSPSASTVSKQKRLLKRDRDKLALIDEKQAKEEIVLKEVNYEELLPTQCDLSQVNFSNEHERNLITRIYVKVSNLCSYLSDFGSPANLKFYLNQPDKFQLLPLYYAIKSNNLEAVKYLLSIGSSREKTSAKGDPAAHLACLLGSPLEMVEYLLANDDLYKADQDGWTVLHCASNQGHLHLVKYLIEKRFMNVNSKDAKTKLTCLQLAAINDRPEIIEYLLGFNTSSATRERMKNTDGTLQRPVTVGTSKLCPENLELFNAQNEKDVNRQLEIYLSNPFSNKPPSIYSSNNKPVSNKLPRKNNLKRKPQNSVISAQLDSNENSDSSNKFSYLKTFPKKTLLEPVIVYKDQLSRYKAEPQSVYKHQTINLKSCNDEGHNVFHLACLYGRYESVNFILKKFGSNQLDINKPDIKGRTCMDLAWTWVLNTKLQHNNCGDEYLSDTDNMDFLERRIKNEIKLIELLNQYGAKFSSHKLLLYSFEPTRKSSSRLFIEYNNARDLQSSIPSFPKDNKVLQYTNQLQEKSNDLISIFVYLKSILFLLKLNLPTMFLKDKHFVRLDEFKSTCITPMSRRFSCSSRNSKISENTFNPVSFIEPVINSNDSSLVKKDLAQNLHDLIEFVQYEVDNQMEKQLYFKYLHEAFECLSTSSI